MKPFASSLLLLLLAVVLGGAIWWNEREPAPREGSVVLLRLTPEAGDNLRLVSGGRELVLRREGGKWRVAQGGKRALADPDAVDALLKILTPLESNAPVVEPGELRQYGLDKPTRRVVTSSGTVEFGSSPPFDRSRIYARSGKIVALVPVALSQVVSRPLDEWRDRAVLRFKPKNVKFIDIESEAFEGRLLHIGDKWQVSQSGPNPKAAVADAATVQSFLSALSQTKVVKFLDDRPKSLGTWGLSKPAARVSFGSGEVLTIGKKLSGGYAARNEASPAVFLLPDTLYGLINRPMNAWRSREVWRYKINDLSRLEITFRSQTRAFSQQNGRWTSAMGTALAPQRREAEHEAVLDVLLAAQELRVSRFIEEPPPAVIGALKAPQLVLKVPQHRQTFVLAARDKAVYARWLDGSEAPDYLALPPDALASLRAALDILFPAKKR